MKKYVVIIWLAIPVVGFSQPSHGEEAYKEFIRKFYYHLLEDNKVTVNEATDLFGSNALEDESFIFNAICDSDPNQKICSERSIYGHEWGDITSVFFSELKKNKNQRKRRLKKNAKKRQRFAEIAAAAASSSSRWASHRSRRRCFLRCCRALAFSRTRAAAAAASGSGAGAAAGFFSTCE